MDYGINVTTNHSYHPKNVVPFWWRWYNSQL